MLASLFTARAATLITPAAGVAVLGAAYIFEHGFDYHPCELCLYQRLPWWIAIAVGCGAMWAMRRMPDLSRMLTMLAGVTVLAGAVLAAYHAGVEYQWWEGPSGCTGAIQADNIEDLRAALLAAPVVRCDEVPWSLFGISMAGYNFLLSLIVGLLAVVAPMRKS